MQSLQASTYCPQTKQVAVFQISASRTVLYINNYYNNQRLKIGLVLDFEGHGLDFESHSYNLGLGIMFKF